MSEMKELTFTVRVKVQVRADLPEEGLRVEAPVPWLVRGEGLDKVGIPRVQWMEFTSERAIPPQEVSKQALPPVTAEELAELLRAAERLTPELQPADRVLTWRLANDLAAGRKSVADVRSFLIELVADYDHEESAHKQNNGACRRCNAQRLLQKMGGLR